MNKVALSGFSGVRSAAHTAHEAASVTFDFVSRINVENALSEPEISNSRIYIQDENAAGSKRKKIFSNVMNEHAMLMQIRKQTTEKTPLFFDQANFSIKYFRRPSKMVSALTHRSRHIFIDSDLYFYHMFSTKAILSTEQCGQSSFFS